MRPEVCEVNIAEVADVTLSHRTINPCAIAFNQAHNIMCAIDTKLYSFSQALNAIRLRKIAGCDSPVLRRLLRVEATRLVS